MGREKVRGKKKEVFVFKVLVFFYQFHTMSYSVTGTGFSFCFQWGRLTFDIKDLFLCKQSQQFAIPELVHQVDITF